MARPQLLVILIILQLTQSINCFTAYDCGGPTLETQTISLVDARQCSMYGRNITTRDEMIQLIQPKDMDEIKFIRCYAKVHHLVQRCGKTFNQLTHAGMYTELISYEREDCELMHKTKIFSYTVKTQAGEVTKNKKIIKGSINSFSDTTRGTISESGSCQESSDSSVINGVTVQYPSQISSFEVVISEEVARFDVKDKKMIIPNGNTFSFSEGKGFSADYGHIFWSTDFLKQSCMYEETNFIVLYEGPATKTIEYPEDGPALLSYIFELGDYQTQLFITGETKICNSKALKTEHPKLAIFEQSLGTRFLLESKAISPLDINLATYFNSKMLHVVHHTKMEVDKLYQLFKYEQCKSDNRVTRNLQTIAILSPYDFAYSYTELPGYSSVKMGEVIYLSKCQPVEVMYHPNIQGICFQELPVIYGNRSMFMTPRSRVLTTVGTEVDCTAGFSPRFKISDMWYSPGSNGLISTTNPDIIIPSHHNYTFTLIKNLASGGIYTQAALDKMQKLLLSPMEEHALSNSITRGLDGRAHLPEGFRLTNGFQVDELDTLSNRIKTKLTVLVGGLTTTGNIFSLIIGTIVCIRILKTVINTFINAFILKTEYGCGWWLLFSCWENIVHLFITRRMKAELKKTAEPAEEQCELIDRESLYPSLRTVTTRRPNETV
jgi:hypothetical protein